MQEWTRPSLRTESHNARALFDVHKQTLRDFHFREKIRRGDE